MYDKSFFAEGQVFLNESEKIVITRVDRFDDEDVTFSGVCEDGTVFDFQPVEILNECECVYAKGRPFLDAMLDLRKKHLNSEEERRQIVEHLGGTKVFCEATNITKGTLYNWVRNGKATARTLTKIETLLNKAGLSL